MIKLFAFQEEKEQQELEREREAERRRMAEAMAGMEGAVNTTEDPTAVPPTTLTMTTSDSQPSPAPTVTESQEKYWSMLYPDEHLLKISRTFILFEATQRRSLVEWPTVYL